MSVTAEPQVSDRARELVEELAREVSGGDPSAYAQTMVALLNVAGEVAEAPDGARVAAAAEHLARPPAPAGGRRRLRSAAVAPVDSTLYADPVYQANLPYVLRNRRRIVGGRPTADFPECVAVGGAQRWCCSGFLVASNVVLTAAHCPREHDCADRVLVGGSTDPGAQGRIVEVADVHVRDDYQRNGPNDLALLVLREDVPGFERREVASAEALGEARTVRLVGFGYTDVGARGGYGAKRAVDVPIASSNPAFGAAAEREFVAGKPLLDRDSCSGDSGGPAYIETNNGWLVAGATSRAVRNSRRPCGDGGIYARLHVFEDWINSAPGGHY